MRLTLRTLLAYLDEILEPADAAALGKKIEESEFATTLMHRTRDVTRRLRLGAPKIEGRGMGLDPNTVAEYLDNTLPAERVPDFEKVCLESDVHLAEVASAHQILALVLGEPAEFESRSRERMYALASVGEKPTVPAENGKAAPAAVVTTTGERPARSKKRKKRRQPEVPDYLRESSKPRRNRLWIAAALAVLVLAAGGILALKAMAPDTWRRLTGQQVAVNDAADSGADAAAATNVEAEGQTPAEGSDAKGRKQSPPEDLTEPSAAAEGEDEASAGKSGKPTQPPATEDGEDADAPFPPLPDEAPAEQSSPKARSDATDKGDQSSAKSARVKRAATSGEVIGRLISDHDVLLRWNGEQEAWVRVPGRESIHAGDRLLALPSYQPSIALGAGVTVQLMGGALVELEAPDSDGAPEIRVDDGRVILMTVAKPDVFVRLQAGDSQSTAAFGRDDATLAIEVARDLPEGADPEKQTAVALVNLYVAAGEMTIVTPDGGPEKIKAPGHRNLNSGPRAVRDSELPAWIKSNELSPIEKRAKIAVDEHLAAGEPVSQTLRDLLTGKRMENSLLALRSLALMDDFEPLVPVFNEDAPNQKNAWTPLIESLRAAMMRGPATAAKVREAFQAQRGEEQGAALYRMLWGYDRQQLQDGADRELVDYLSHKDLDFRVLSFWNLHHLTGWQFPYRPEYPEAKRRSGVAAWQRKLSSGQIVPAEGAE